MIIGRSFNRYEAQSTRKPTSQFKSIEVKDDMVVILSFITTRTTLGQARWLEST